MAGQHPTQEVNTCKHCRPPPRPSPTPGFPTHTRQVPVPPDTPLPLPLSAWCFADILRGAFALSYNNYVLPEGEPSIRQNIPSALPFTPWPASVPSLAWKTAACWQAAAEMEGSVPIPQTTFTCHQRSGHQSPVHHIAYS
ncbi:hypothetical protein E2C01_084497 [Portunus trituberculatus]|uniref:Uncharacterized protein n=1 Tax=Portunus trituberculatus TaxID=210409 RepID=A0A5B7JAX2_PORTR|nr:hypothetical protein [Portunus trituberculatus]